MTALLVPLDGPIELFLTEVDPEERLRAHVGQAPLVWVHLGREGTERGRLLMGRGETEPVNVRATEITPLVTGGAYVQVRGAAVFEGIDEELWTQVIVEGMAGGFE